MNGLAGGGSVIAFWSMILRQAIPEPCNWSLPEEVQLIPPAQSSAPASLSGVMLMASLCSFSGKAAHQKT